MKTSTVLRILTLILLIIVAVMFFAQVDQGLFTIAMLLLLAVALGYQYAKRREDKDEN